MDIEFNWYVEHVKIAEEEWQCRQGEIEDKLSHGVYDSANYSDYFDGDAIEQAEAAATKPEAHAILKAAYKGADITGIGVDWAIAG